MFEYCLTALTHATDSALVKVHNALADSLGPFATALFCLYLVLQGYRTYFGSLSPSTLFSNILIAATSCGMLLHSAGFTLIRDVAQLPTEVGLATLKALAGLRTSASAARSLDQLLEQLINGITSVIGHTEVWNFAPLIVGVLLAGIVMVFFAYIAYLLVLSAILTTVFLALFPVALALSLLDACKPILQGLIRQTLTYALVPCLLYAILGFTSGLLREWTQTFVASGGSLGDLMKVVPIFFLLIVNILLLSQLVGAASGLVGGVGMRPATMPIMPTWMIQRARSPQRAAKP